MLEKLRNRLLAFIESDKDTPKLAGFAVGFYMLLFYYSRNFALANSWEQISVLSAYYIIMPSAVFFSGYTLLSLTKLEKFRRHFLFVGTAGFFAFFFLQLTNDIFPTALFFGVMLLVVCAAIFFRNYYKAFIPLLFFICIFNAKPMAGVMYKSIIASNEWKKLPDDITEVKFTYRPNIYYIQPDGYTSFRNLRDNPHYGYNNTDFENFLRESCFTLYDNYRSNYPTTLLSNSSIFAMKHHYIAKDVESYSARKIITEGNPVLQIFKNNGYKSSFITEKAYLLMNRPSGGYDYYNIKNEELPYLKDGLDTDRDIFADLKVQMKENGISGNFYFLEKFEPTHITNFKANSAGVEGEKKIYIEGLQNVNIWLKEVIAYISANDSQAIIIIGADHGGYTGLTCTADSNIGIKDKELVYSIFGAQLAIKWGDSASAVYDRDLQSGVNLFRTVFAFLARDPGYLDSMEANGSYINLHSPSGVHQYIGDDGKTVFRKI